MRQAPQKEQLEFLASLEVEQAESVMKIAWQQLSASAQQVLTDDPSLDVIEEEYQDLFIGIGRGEVMPFGSWHITGAMMEKPLAVLRHDLKLLGFEREEQVKEPEDHIAALCEVMAALTHEDEALQQVMFNKHIVNWYHSLVTQIESAQHAQFYLALANLMNAFFQVEQVRFSDANAHLKNGLKIEVKNIVDTIEG
ncbi:molecular chaperone TorD family protein [Vibrio sp. FNV 38]|nr:molecular chaperone TorD family protein [Vibrio sp. FNV 38]